MRETQEKRKERQSKKIENRQVKNNWNCRTETGITLIALVVTIIILLILSDTERDTDDRQ